MILLTWAVPLLLCLATGIAAFSHSCVQVQNEFVGVTFLPSLTYICIVTQEGFTNWDQLKNIHITADTTVSFYDVATSDNGCMQKSASTAWTVQSDKIILDCDQEFTSILSSELPPAIINAFKEIRWNMVPYPTVVVSPQTGMWIMIADCQGDGKITLSTGVGVDETEYRFVYRSWTCSSVPKWIVSFDEVLTIEGDASVQFDIASSSDLENILNVSPGDKIVVLTSGRSNDLQNLKGTENRARIQIADSDLYDVKADLQLTFDSKNTGAVGLLESKDGSVQYYYGGRYNLNFHTNYFEVLYNPKEMEPSEINYSQDTIIIDISISEKVSTAKPLPTTNTTKSTNQVTTTGPTTMTSPVTTASNGPFCNCDVDKFGYANGWNYNDIWLDVIFILDTSEAMGQTALADASALIESFIGNGDIDFLITDTSAPFYTRIGVISMSDVPEILYNLNMTKDDQVLGKANIKKGVKEIDVVDAFYAALNMLNDGLTKVPNRANTRQVIYYITDSDAKTDVSALDDFKASKGVIIVNNFLQEGEIERPGLRNLASEGFYFLNSNYMDGLQSFCKANCFCKPDMDTYEGGDPAIKASNGCYHPTSAGVPFSKAKDVCATGKGIIAPNHDEQQGRFLQGLMAKVFAKSDYFWIGYEKSDAGVWQWEDQSTDPYTNWDANEPSSATVAKCAYVDTTTSTLPWGAGNCQLGFPYVCLYKPCSAGYKDC